MVFVDRKVHSVFEEFSVDDERIESVNIEFKNLPAKEVYQYMKFQIRHCDDSSECAYPNDDNKEYTMELGK